MNEQTITPPPIQPDYGQLIENLTNEISQLRTEITSIKSEMWTPAQLDDRMDQRMTVQLQDYPKTDTVSKMIIDTVAGLNTGLKDMGTLVNDGLDNVNRQIQTFTQDMQARLSEHDSKIKHNTDDLASYRDQVSNYQQLAATVNASAQEHDRDLKEIKHLILGDLENNGIITRLQLMENVLPGLQTSLADEANASASFRDAWFAKEKQRADRNAFIRKISVRLAQIVTGGSVFGTMLAELIRGVL